MRNRPKDVVILREMSTIFVPCSELHKTRNCTISDCIISGHTLREAELISVLLSNMEDADKNCCSFE